MTKQVVNLYWRDTDNVGDAMSGSCLYFKFPLPVKFLDIKEMNMSKEELAESFIILGGGGHIHLPHPDYNDGIINTLIERSTLSKWSVTWGIGHNIHGTVEQKFPDCLDNFLLSGIRDLDNPYLYVPCASCMHPIFDFYKSHPPWKDEFVYCHTSRVLKPEKPFYFCEGADFYDVIQKIASAETIYTNSYHGVYWGLLLNRRVIIPKPNSSKFYKIHPFHVENDELHFDKSPNYLGACRTINTNFHHFVLRLIHKYVEES